MPRNVLRCQCGNKRLPHRCIIVTLVCLSLFLSITQQLVFKLVIMELGIKDKTNNTSECKTEDNEEKLRRNYENAIWSKDQQGILINVFYIGYISMQLPGGFLGDKFGSRYIFTTSLLLSSSLTIAQVFVVDYAEFWCVVACQLFMGFSHGGLYPNTATLIAKWIPPRNIALVTGSTYSIIGVSYVFSRKSGLLYSNLHDWRYLFYIWGSAGLVCYVWCMLFVFSTPQKDPSITETEKDFLKEEIIPSAKKVEINMLCPKFIIDFAVVASIVLAQIAHDLCFFVAISYLPDYYEDVLYAEMTLLDDCEWLLLPVGIFSGLLADKLIYTKNYNRTRVRKVYVAIGLVVPGIYLATMSYMACHRMIVCITRIFAIIAMGFFYSGFKANLLDITHNFSGTLMGLVGAAGALINMLCYSMVEHMSPHNTLKEWKVLTWVPFVASVAASVIYFILATSIRRPWDIIDDELP